ncbi:MAG TPA: DUF1080 domain-containing protein [Planctomycetota bacterium]|nr:DUF1080 domain-containing protein [Planctomycetota bacterium]
MRCILAIVFSASLAAQDKPALPAPDADGWISLFNGKDLTGWQGDMNVWRVVDGYISGKIDKIGYNTFLVCPHSFSDFELELKFWLVESKGNSGIQYRSEVKDPAKWVVGGYQADIGKGWWGALYEERGRGVLVKPTPEGAKAAKADDWNQYVIRAEGSRLTQIVNGVKTVDFEDTDEKKRKSDGILALQYHAPGNFEIRFKDIRIRPLKK